MPVFEGLNPEGWIFRAERYFAVYRLSEAECLEAAVISLDGKALAWFQWKDGQRPIRSWPELKAAILDRFRETQEGSTYERFLGLRQEGTIREYRRAFELMAVPLKSWVRSLKVAS